MDKRFDTGAMTCTPCIKKRLEDESKFGIFLRSAVGRYLNCDWGDSPEEDKRMNDKAVLGGDARIFAAYKIPGSDERIWIITEADRSATTILFPDEY